MIWQYNCKKPEHIIYKLFIYNYATKVRFQFVPQYFYNNHSYLVLEILSNDNLIFSGFICIKDHAVPRTANFVSYSSTWLN